MDYKKSVWRDVKLKKKTVFEDMVYYEPEGWEKRSAYPDEGTYYYPYHDRTALIWITRKKFPKECFENGFPYYSVASGWAKGAENIISISDHSKNGLSGKRVIHWLPINEDIMVESITYFSPVGEYVYACCFGEQDHLSRGMRAFAGQFMEKYRAYKKEDEPKVEKAPYEVMVNKVVRLTNLTYRRLAKRGLAISME